MIIGAGPSGSHLAFKLAGLGYEVVVLDSKAASGEMVCCTGIVSRECLDSFAIDRRLVLREANSARFVAPSGKCLRLWRDGEVAYVLDRPALNETLTNRARVAGAKYIFGAQVIDIQPTANGLQVEANYHGERPIFEAKAAVLATGFGSALPTKLGLGKIKDFIVGAQAQADVKADEIEVYLDQALAPGGFAWLVPTANNKGLAGLLTRHHPESLLKGFLAFLEAQGKITSTGVKKGYEVIPLRPLPRSYGDRLLVVGEAAGQVKPMTGGGIYFGLLCADIAADTLHQSFQTGDLSANRLATYERQWHVQLNRELQIGYWLRRLYERLGNQQIERIFNMMSKHNIARFIAEMDDFSFDRHGAMGLKLVKRLLTDLFPGIVY